MQGGIVPASFWGQLIYQLRTEKDMSQRELAISAKVNRSTLRRIEEGTSSGDIAMIEAVLAVLGYELEAMAQQNGARARITAAQPPAAPEMTDRSKLAASRLAGMNATTLRQIYA